MAESEFEPQKHKVVVVLDSTDYANLQLGAEGSDILYDNAVFVLQHPQDGAMHPVLSDLDDAGLLRPGTVLVRSPYVERQYADLAEAEVRFAADKFIYFTALFRELGACSVRAGQIKTRSQGNTHDFKISGSGIAENIPVDASAKMAYEWAERIVQKIQVDTKFSGGEPDIDRAKQCLERYRLRDAEALALIDMRTGKVNRLSEQHILLDVSSETRRILDIVTEVGIPDILGIKAEYKGVLNEKAEYRLDITVNF